jgi:uncharacterized protein YutE (UPF0331/DUF86 family)
MDRTLLNVKLNQLMRILTETEDWLQVPVVNFAHDVKLVRACQRNLQLLVEYASDINGILVLELGTRVPGSYRESFTSVFAMDALAGLSEQDRAALLASVDWRNDLIHEYEPAESHELFYTKLKEFLIAYRDYVRVIHRSFTAKNSLAA